MNVDSVRVSLLEKSLVNFATIFDTSYHHARDYLLDREDSLRV